MLNFFRKIRQNLLNEGKTGRYIKYAIGEILLVVIGILIALQINNWNENNKNLKQELINISDIYSEIKQNKEMTQTVYNYNVVKLEALETLLSMSSENLELISEEQLNHLILRATSIDYYTPSTGKLYSYLNSDNFNNQNSKKLINLLYQYSESDQNLEIQNKGVIDVFHTRVVPLISNNISIKNLFHKTNPMKIPKSENKVDVRSYIKTLEFENLVTLVYASTTSISSMFSQHIEIMRNITLQIESNFPNVENNDKNHD